MNQKIPIVFIGSPEMATVFQNSLSLDSSIFHFYTTEPFNALKNENYEKQSEQNSHLVVGPGTAGCSIAHLNAQSIIQNHFIAPPPGRADTASGIKPKSVNSGGFVFETDAIFTNYGRDYFLKFVSALNTCEFKMIQLGGLKSTSGRKGQKVNVTSSLRNYFLSNSVHDLYEDSMEFFMVELKIVKGWIGGSHAYWIHTDAIKILHQNQPGFLNSLDDYYRTISWNTGWIGRTRQNLFIQSDTPSLIKKIGR